MEMDNPLDSWGRDVVNGVGVEGVGAGICKSSKQEAHGEAEASQGLGKTWRVRFPQQISMLQDEYG